MGHQQVIRSVDKNAVPITMGGRDSGNWEATEEVTVVGRWQPCKAEWSLCRWLMVVLAIHMSRSEQQDWLERNKLSIAPDFLLSCQVEEHPVDPKPGGPRRALDSAGVY